MLCTATDSFISRYVTVNLFLLPNLFLLSSPSPTVLGKRIGTLLVVFGVVNLVKCQDKASSASFWVHYNITTYLLT